MTVFQVTARIQSDGTIKMIPTYRKLETAELIHRIVEPLAPNYELVVWWPERLDPAFEEACSREYAETLARKLGLRP